MLADINMVVNRYLKLFGGKCIQHICQASRVHTTVVGEVEVVYKTTPQGTYKFKMKITPLVDLMCFYTFQKLSLHSSRYSEM